MSTPTWVTLANANQFSQITTGSASNFAVVTDVSGGGSIPGQAFQTTPAQLYPGQLWRFTATGTWSSTGSPGVSIGIYYGGAAGSPLCYGSVAAGSTTPNAASIPWMLQAMGRLGTVGASIGSWNVIGKLLGIYYTGGLAGAGLTMMPTYTSAAQYDTSTARLITVAANCSAANASNVITVQNFAVEYLTEQ